MNDEALMREAIEVARRSHASGDVPVGALIINQNGEIISIGNNERELHGDPTAHAEIVALRRASEKTKTWRLDNHTLVVTLEPCAMCAGAIAQARISTLVFGSWDEKAGAVGSVWDILRDPRSIFKVEVRAGVLKDDCALLLKDFIQGVRTKD